MLKFLVDIFYGFQSSYRIVSVYDAVSFSDRFGSCHIVSVSNGVSVLGCNLVVYSGFCRKGDAISSRYSRFFVFSVADCWSVVVSRPNLGVMFVGKVWSVFAEIFGRYFLRFSDFASHRISDTDTILYHGHHWLSVLIFQIEFRCGAG